VNCLILIPLVLSLVTGGIAVWLLCCEDLLTVLGTIIPSLILSAIVAAIAWSIFVALKFSGLIS